MRCIFGICLSSFFFFSLPLAHAETIVASRPLFQYQGPALGFHPDGAVMLHHGLVFLHNRLYDRNIRQKQREAINQAFKKPGIFVVSVPISVITTDHFGNQIGVSSAIHVKNFSTHNEATIYATRLRGSITSNHRIRGLPLRPGAEQVVRTELMKISSNPNIGLHRRPHLGQTLTTHQMLLTTKPTQTLVPTKLQKLQLDVLRSQIEQNVRKFGTLPHIFDAAHKQHRGSRLRR